MKKYSFYILGILLAAFGLLTLFLSGSVLFDLFGIRAKEGNYVLLVVWANFIASFLYLFAAHGFIKQKKQTTLFLALSLVVLITGFLGLLIHINSGGIYEEKTPKAMVFRSGVTLLFLLSSYFKITKNKKEQ